MEPQTLITEIAEGLKRVDGVSAVVLGGSRARGTHRPDSDIDVGIEGKLEAEGFFGLWQAIEEGAPGWQVELVELDRTRAPFADRVRIEGELVYEA